MQGSCGAVRFSVTSAVAGALVALAACGGGGGGHGGGSTTGGDTASGILTQRYDAQRSGQNLSELALSPASVSSSTFGKRFACPIDGEAYAEPLVFLNL